MESSPFFPLGERWLCAGYTLFDHFYNTSWDDDDDGGEHGINYLIRVILRMTKGLVVEQAATTNLVGRKRSYSFGSEGAVVLDPYPETMVQTIVTVLQSENDSLSDIFREEVVTGVVGSSLWINGVFTKLDVSVRTAIANCLLKLRSNGNDSAGIALHSLKLTIGEFKILLEECGKTTNLVGLTFLTDCIRVQAPDLGGGSSGEMMLDLIEVLFGQLLTLSILSDDTNDGGSDYTRFSLLQTILALYQSTMTTKHSRHSIAPSKRRRSNSITSDFSLHSSLLVALVATTPQTLNDDNSKSQLIQPLSSQKTKSTALMLLTHLCALHPKSVVKYLLPVISPEGVALNAIVPAFCRHAPEANLSITDLIKVFVEKSNSTLLQRTVEVFGTMPYGELGVASLLSSYLACEGWKLFNDSDGMDLEGNGEEEDRVSSILEVLGCAPPKMQIRCMLQMLGYVGRFMTTLGGVNEQDVEPMTQTAHEDSKEEIAMTISLKDLIFFTIHGAVGAKDCIDGQTTSTINSNFSDKELRTIMWVVTTLLKIIRECLSTPTAKKLIRTSGSDNTSTKEDEKHANVCLGLWQQLMHVQSSSITKAASSLSSSSDDDSSKLSQQFWNAARVSTQDCLLLLQRVLPVSHFLASVMSLLKGSNDDGGVVDDLLRRRALKLLSDRAEEVDDNVAEATLFLEIIPDLILMVKAGTSDDSESSRGSVAVQQSALFAIERIAQGLCLQGNMEIIQKGASFIFPALQSVVALLSEVNFGEQQDGLDIDTIQGQLFSTAVLCASTLIKALKARSLPLLPKLIEPLVTSLVKCNSILATTELDKDGNTTSAPLGITKLLQQSILRALLAIVETLPQFLASYLSSLFQSNVLPSSTMRVATDSSSIVVRTLAEQLDDVIAVKTPPRQLIPPLTASISSCVAIGHIPEAKCLFSVLNRAIKASTKSAILPFLASIISCIFAAYDSHSDLLPAANSSLMALILKLSETKLRSLYSQFREWRGLEFKESTPQKRFAFWSMSAILAKNLKGIFLPCLATVVVDIVEELDHFASRLCDPSSTAETWRSSKKRKSQSSATDGDSTDSLSLLTLDNIAPLRPLLETLECALKADAHEGGIWIRADDQRYNLIMTPLASLLHARFPDDDKISTSNAENSFYQKFVCGMENSDENNDTTNAGTVSACLTALAVAVGDEFMWKPLNYAIVQACGAETVRVRKAAVSVLLEILKVIGEEYMVLLPECLPVLSELLEDSNEDVVGLAKECVHVAEEVLGESLEDSLK